MDLLKAEILKKRKLAEAVTAESSTGSKFVKQKDLIDAKERERLEAQRQYNASRRHCSLSSNNSSNCDDKNSTTITVAAEVALGDKVSSAITSNDSKAGIAKSKSTKVSMPEYNHLSSKDVKSLLRKRNLPVTLFGEKDVDRRNRYESIKNSSNGDAASNMASTHNEGTSNSTDKDDVIQDDGIEDMNPTASADDTNDLKIFYNPSISFSNIDGLSPENVVYKYFRSLLKQWEYDLSLRPSTVKDTGLGKVETNKRKQCEEYIKPLFKLCKKKVVPVDILDKLVDMVKHCELGDFRTANDLYMRIAIGNACWPTGITMVGIHERSGREKISTSNVAHAMNNELQRKYLTSVKRLITFAQQKRTDVLPSMKCM